MSWLSKVTGSTVGKLVGIPLNPLGIGTGGPIKSGAIGDTASLLKGAFGHAETTLPTTNNDLDQSELQATEASQQALTDQDMAQSQQLADQNQAQLKSVLDTYRQNAYTDLTTGQEGEQMRQYYNNLGLLNSGAFNQNLGNQFAQIQQNSDQQLMTQGLQEGSVLQGILGQGYQTQSDLQTAGLQRQYGLEDTAYQTQLNSVLAKRQDQQNTKDTIIGSLLCFENGTPINMADGSSKLIQSIDLGDLTKGGEVLSVRKSMVGEGSRYVYNGVHVTGSHAVKEGGQWIRVMDSPKALPLHGETTVYSLVTKDHRIFVNGVEFSDEFETDLGYQLTDKESLAILNEQEA